MTILDHIRDIVENTDMQVFGSRQGPNHYWACEPPRRRLINWYTTRTFDIPLPWVWYRFEYYEQFHRSYLWEVYFSKTSLGDNIWASDPFLPNFYDSRPCTTAIDVHHHPIDIINTLWHEGFTQDGRLRWSAEWRYLARQAGVDHLLKRPQILEQLERHDVESIVGITQSRTRPVTM